MKNVSGAGRFNASGKKIGKWVYYHWNENISATEQYNDGELTTAKFFDEAGQAQTMGTPDRESQLKGGIKSWTKFLEGRIHWPEEYDIANVNSVEIVVEFWIDEEGRMQDIEVVVPFADPFNRKAERALSASPVWIPAIKQNRKVRSFYRQPIVFTKNDINQTY